MTDELTMWTVYRRPLDYPQGYVARRWIAEAGEAKPTLDAFFGLTLEEVRGFLTTHYPDLYCISRSVGDEPQIVETWL